jgi:methyl-accepting chemotaxis protein
MSSVEESRKGSRTIVRRSIVQKLLFPMAGIIVVTTMVTGWLMTRQMESDIRSLADEQIQGRMRAILESLMAVNELSLNRVHAGMRVFIDEGEKLGNPALGANVSVGNEVVQNVLLGRRPQANDFVLVDRLKNLMDGTATLFVKRGEGFVRVSTNIKKVDGSRAIGTVLDPNGRAISAIREGKSFYGVVDILGAPYMTGYEPMKDARGETIGIWYVGYPLSALDQLGASIAKSRILSQGFVALLDGKGRIIFKSESIGQTDVQKVLADKAAGDNSWNISKESFPAWGYSIIAAHPESDINDKVKQTYLVVAGASLLVIGVLVALMLGLLRRIILRPINEVILKMDNADLNTAFNSELKDEIGDLERSFDQFVASLKQTMLQVAEAASAVASASSEISSSTEKMAAGSQEQTSQAGEVASAVEEMTRTIVENSGNAGNTAETARQAKAAAEEGGRAVGKTVDGMKRIADVVRKSAETVQGLGKSSTQIGEIIGVIDDIADQTNLLALNAAIEAARAGDQGRGFAVVADEVRRLAERTTTATKEIATMIRTIQKDTAGAVTSMGEGTKHVDEGIRLADQAGVSLSQIVEVSQKVTDMVAQIAAASKQQSSASEQILKNVEAISSVTAETAQGTQQIARAAEDLNQLTEGLQQLVSKFSVSSTEKTVKQSSSHYQSTSRSDQTRSTLAVRENGKLVPHMATSSH